MGEVIATYDAGVDITVETTEAVTGGRFASLPTARNAGGPAGISDSGDGLLKVGYPSAQGAKSFGVFSHDAPSGGRVNVMRGSKVVPVEVSAGITIGAEVMTGTDGRAVTWTAGAANYPLGFACNTTTEAGQFCLVALYNAGSTNNS